MVIVDTGMVDEYNSHFAFHRRGQLSVPYLACELHSLTERNCIADCKPACEKRSPT